MQLNVATVRNVNRALREIKAFEWEGDFKPVARQALKKILEGRMEEEMTEFLGLEPLERYARRHRSIDEVMLACFSKTPGDVVD